MFCHTLHHGLNTVCFAGAAEKELSEAHLLGMMLHELGHIVCESLGTYYHRAIVAGAKTPDEVQMEADVFVAKDLGFKTYTYKKTLEWVSPEEFEKRESYGKVSR
jgi:hypothetical protein